jgi:hypothetical protein
MTGIDCKVKRALKSIFFLPLKLLELLMCAITLRDNVHLSVVKLWHCVHEIKDNEVDSSGCLGDDDGDNLVLGVLFLFEPWLVVTGNQSGKLNSCKI